MSPALAGGFFTTRATREAPIHGGHKQNFRSSFEVCELWNAASLSWEGKLYTSSTNSEMDYFCGSIKNVKDNWQMSR